MESYFGINSSSLKEKFKSKLVQASKYIPKDFVNKAQNAMKRGKHGSFVQPNNSINQVSISGHLEEDYVHVEHVEQNNNHGSGGSGNGKDENQEKRRKSTNDQFESPLTMSNESNDDSSEDRRNEDQRDKYFKQSSDFSNPDDLSNLEDKYQVIQQHRRNTQGPRPELILPDPEQAKNSIIKSLFILSAKQLETQTSYKLKEQAINIMNIINQDKINIHALNDLCFNSGIPDEVKGLRPLLWKIMLNHLPQEIKDWDDHIEKQKEIYDSWKQELIIKPTTKYEEDYKEIKRKMIDHPLSVNQDSTWHQYFKDQEIWDEIEKDVKRTRTDLSFFYKAVDNSKNSNNVDILMKQAESKRSELTQEQKENYIETHADVLGRVLFIYAKLNPGVRYVQGMNEVLAVLYYCFWCFGDESIISNKYLESDLFFCFNNLMIEIRDGFLRELDKEQSGITGKVKTYSNVLKQIDPLVYRNLEEQNVNHQFYALRWQMLLMCQEFDMSNVIVLWDALFSDSERFCFLNYVCCAAVNLKRLICLNGDFADCMENLQRACDQITDVKVLINSAKKIQERHLKIKIKQRIKYEQQMSYEEDQ